MVLAGAETTAGTAGWPPARWPSRTTPPVTLITSTWPRRIKAEPARSTALDVFADAAERDLPLRVPHRPDADVLIDAIDGAEAVVDAILGTGFAGDGCAALRRVDSRGEPPPVRGVARKGRGRHRKRALERGRHERGERRSAPMRAKDAPFTVAVDVPSGLSAQTGARLRGRASPPT